MGEVKDDTGQSKEKWSGLYKVDTSEHILKTHNLNHSTIYDNKSIKIHTSTKPPPHVTTCLVKDTKTDERDKP